MLILLIITALVFAILSAALLRNAYGPPHPVHLRGLPRLWAQAPRRHYPASTREARQ
jgi:hypothetical protein